jgi:16S rRNA (adenine1518-N6/adenine1519-N6)-dimethyltransferase
VIAFEIDRDLCIHLKDKFKKEIEMGRLKLICGDVLEYWKQNLVDRDYDLVANLPYYIATNIVIKALQDERCKNILVMLQKEVADKFSAKVNEKDFSSLALIADSVGEAKKVTIVKPGSFIPPPKVDSAVLLIKKSRNLEDSGFLEFLKIAFKQPRKTLFKNLSQKYDKEFLLSIFSKLNLASTIRPHQANTSIYHQIFKEVKEQIDGESKPAKEQTKKEI